MSGRSHSLDRLEALLTFLGDLSHGSARARRVEEVVDRPMSEILAGLSDDGRVDEARVDALCESLDAARIPFESSPSWRGPGRPQIQAQETNSLANTVQYLELFAALERADGGE